MNCINRKSLIVGYLPFTGNSVRLKLKRGKKGRQYIIKGFHLIK
jgi:hypothetical protein